MKDILQEIAKNKRREIYDLYPYEYKEPKDIKHLPLPPVYSMKKSLQNTPAGIIAEFKRRSPSKGEISPMADVNKIVRQYNNGGAAALSILTDTRFFGGAITDLAMATKLSGEIPVLRKDFIVSKVQIKEARKLGASAILLIAAILTKNEMKEFHDYAHYLDLEVLTEIHEAGELDKITYQPDMLGVNNRNLSSFQTDVNHSYELIKSLPDDILLVAESGIKSPEDIKRLKDVGFTGFLIGEAFMSTPNPGETLRRFVNESR